MNQETTVGDLRRALKGFSGSLVVQVSMDSIDICEPIKDEPGAYEILKSVEVE